MTFQTESENDRTAQKACIGAAVGRVATLAAFYTNRSVLENKRAAFFRVTFQTRLLIRQGLIYHAGPGTHPPRRGGGSMRVVAIGAVHEAFVHPMLEGHGKLAPHGGVAPVAQVSLGLCEEKLGGGRLMDRMATGAGDVIESVDRTADIRSRQGLTMTAKTSFQGLLCRENREGGDRRLAWRLHVGRTRPVASFTACVPGRLLPGSNALEVGVLIEFGPHVRMATLADRAANKASRWQIGGGSECPRHQKQQAGAEEFSHYTTIRYRLPLHDQLTHELLEPT